MESIPSSGTCASATQCALGRQTLQCPTHFLVWKSYPAPSHQFTHKRKNLHQPLPCVHEGTQQPQPYPEPQLGWTKQCPAVQEETRYPRTLQSGQLSVLILEDLLFPSSPSSWNQGITKGRLSSSSSSNPQRVFYRKPLADGIYGACRVFLCFHLIFTGRLARP